MGRLYVASVLISISGKGQTSKPAEVPLAPIVPGAWAAWSKNWEAEQAAAPTVQPTKAPVVTTLKPAGSKA